MSLMQAVASVFKNYANFKGRARRSEYWWFLLFNILVYIGALIIGAVFASVSDEPSALMAITFVLTGLYSFATIIPSLSVTCRRLHDIGKSGAYIFFGLLPVVGEILLWVWEFQDGQPWTNQYGPDPKGRNMSPLGGAYYPPASGPVGTYSYPVSEPKRSWTDSKKACPHCGASIDEDAVFCIFCGKDTRKKVMYEEPIARSERPAPRKKTCVNCGSSIDLGAKYCPVCGKNTDVPSTLSKSTARPKGFSTPTDLD